MQNPAFAYVMTKITPKQQDFNGIRAVGDFGNFENDVDRARVLCTHIVRVNGYMWGPRAAVMQPAVVGLV